MRNDKGQFISGNNGKPFGAKTKIKTDVLKSIICRLEIENRKLLIENIMLKNKIAKQ